jgi:hypothetical protein
MTAGSRWLSEVALAAARGVGIGAVVGVLVHLVATPAYDCSQDGFGCIGVTAGALALALLGSLLVGWLGFRFLAAPLAFPTAVAGAVATLLVVAYAGPEWPRALVPMFTTAVIVYGVAGMLLSRPSPDWLKALFGVALAIGMVSMVMPW